jgi:hypothetical protein
MQNHQMAHFAPNRCHTPTRRKSLADAQAPDFSGSANCRKTYPLCYMLRPSYLILTGCPNALTGPSALLGPSRLSRFRQPYRANN